MASYMMNVWGQLCARGLGYVTSHLQHTKANIHEITKVVKMFITEKAVLGHNLTEIASYVSTEDILAPTRVLIPVASTTTLSNQNCFDGLEGVEPMAAFEWSFYGLFLWLICLLAFLGLCIGSLRFPTVFSPARLAIRNHSLPPSSHREGNYNRKLL